MTMPVLNERAAKQSRTQRGSVSALLVAMRRTTTGARVTSSLAPTSSRRSANAAASPSDATSTTDHFEVLRSISRSVQISNVADLARHSASIRDRRPSSSGSRSSSIRSLASRYDLAPPIDTTRKGGLYRRDRPVIPHLQEKFSGRRMTRAIWGSRRSAACILHRSSSRRGFRWCPSHGTAGDRPASSGSFRSGSSAGVGLDFTAGMGSFLAYGRRDPRRGTERQTQWRGVAEMTGLRRGRRRSMMWHREFERRPKSPSFARLDRAAARSYRFSRKTYVAASTRKSALRTLGSPSATGRPSRACRTDHPPQLAREATSLNSGPSVPNERCFRRLKLRIERLVPEGSELLRSKWPNWKRSDRVVRVLEEERYHPRAFRTVRCPCEGTSHVVVAVR